MEAVQRMRLKAEQSGKTVLYEPANGDYHDRFRTTRH